MLVSWVKGRWATEDLEGVEVEASQEATVVVEEAEEGVSRELGTGSVQTRESGFSDFTYVIN